MSQTAKVIYTAKTHTPVAVKMAHRQLGWPSGRQALDPWLGPKALEEIGPDPGTSGYFFKAAAIRPTRTRSPFRKSLNVSGSWKAGSNPREIKLRSTKIGS